MRLIGADNIEFRCQYEGECTADKESCKRCDDYVCSFREVQSLQAIYDTDKVVERLEETKAYMLYENMNADVKWIDKAIEIVKAGGNNDD